jgi:hypothetical protein
MHTTAGVIIFPRFPITETSFGFGCCACEYRTQHQRLWANHAGHENTDLTGVFLDLQQILNS